MATGDMRTRYVEVSGRRLHIREWGDAEGEAVLLIHGIPTSGLLWEQVAPYLARSSRVIAPDMLGYGDSDVPEGLPVDIASHAVYLLQLMDALDVWSASVVGHDIGGGVAQILAVRHAERVRRLGLVNSVCYDSWPIPEIRAVQATAPLVQRMPAGATSKGLEMFLKRGFVNKDRGESFLETVVQPFSTPDGLNVFVEHATALDSAQTEELVPMLGELAMPVAIVWGRQDPFQKPHYAEKLEADIPDAELTWIEDSSHFAPVDTPAQVAEALVQLMERPVVRAGG